MTITTEIPGKAIGPVSGVVASIFALSSIAGPPLGGAITSHGSWRWVFWLKYGYILSIRLPSSSWLVFSVPAGAILIGLVLWVLPKNATSLSISIRSFGHIDWPGGVSSLTASVLLVFALEEGGVSYSWGSATIVASFVIQGLSWACFTFWELFLTSRDSRWQMLPVFPANLIGQRVIASAILYTSIPLIFLADANDITGPPS